MKKLTISDLEKRKLDLANSFTDEELRGSWELRMSVYKALKNLNEKIWTLKNHK